ncbi:MAG: hypothetical protein ABL903_20220 [Methylococcales bacterium]
MRFIRLLTKCWLLSILVLASCEASAAILPPVSDNERCQYLGDPLNNASSDDFRLAFRVSDYFKANEDSLERLVNEWNTSSCVFDDGSPVLRSLSIGYQMALNAENRQESLIRVEYLKTKYPNTAFVALAEAIYWKEYAWLARGHGFALSVDPVGWKLFNERLEKAEKVLIDSKPYAAELPIWYVEMIQVQSLLNRPVDDRTKIFLEGSNKHRSYYLIYFAMLNSISPKWGGSWEEVDNLVKSTVDKTQDVYGKAMYARLYMYINEELPRDEKLYKTTLASWPDMKRSFEDMMTQYPSSNLNLNKFAMFACVAEDKETFLKLRRTIGKDKLRWVWPRNNSLELCELKFGYVQ